MKAMLSDTVRLPSGDEGTVTGTMTLGLEKGGKVRRSVCVQTTHGPVWISDKDVVVVTKAKR